MKLSIFNDFGYSFISIFYIGLRFYIFFKCDTAFKNGSDLFVYSNFFISITLYVDLKFFI